MKKEYTKLERQMYATRKKIEDILNSMQLYEVEFYKDDAVECTGNFADGPVRIRFTLSFWDLKIYRIDIFGDTADKESCLGNVELWINVMTMKNPNKQYPIFSDKIRIEEHKIINTYNLELKSVLNE